MIYEQKYKAFLDLDNQDGTTMQGLFQHVKQFLVIFRPDEVYCFPS